MATEAALITDTYIVYALQIVALLTAHLALGGRTKVQKSSRIEYTRKLETGTKAELERPSRTRASKVGCGRSAPHQPIPALLLYN